LVLPVALAAGCVVSYHPPDLGGLYDRAAQHHGPERNPVVLIPGVTGSTLVDGASGRIVWGAFIGDYARPGDPADARLLALPMRPGASLDELRDEVRPDGVLDRVRVRVLGIPVHVRAYVQLLAALGAGGYRDETLGLSGAVDYGTDHYTCFQFPYDWRRDVAENARRLGEFLEEKRAYVRAESRRRLGVDPGPVRFDVVAHSMGGLVLRYYLRYGGAEPPPAGAPPPVTWAGAESVERALLVGPPNAGSLDALLDLVRGHDPGPFVPTYPPAIVGTFPSLYQALPRARHGVLVEAGNPERPVEDLFDPALWERMGWGLASPAEEGFLRELLPEVSEPAERRRIALDHLAKSLARARRITEALDRAAPPPPAHLELYLVAGDAIPTAAAARVDPRTGALEVIARAPGDGTVLRASALLDERSSLSWQPYVSSPIPWSDILFLFTGHLGLTRDPVFTDNLLFWLLEDARGPAARRTGPPAQRGRLR
jgi:hypothetical protein